MARKKAAKPQTSKSAVFSRQSPDQLAIPAGYGELLDEIKGRIRSAQIKAVLAVTSELLVLYWSVGRDIVQRQRREGWGAKVIDRLAADLRSEFPEMSGLSRTNVYRMRAFYLAYESDGEVYHTGSHGGELAFQTADRPEPCRLHVGFASTVGHVVVFRLGSAYQ